MTIHFCMPFWGDPADLRTAVESVLGQRDPDWLLTVIDDCYPDPAVIEYFDGIDDPRVEYRRNAENVGITENFRRAVAASRAPLTVILGSDDLLEPTYVETMRNLADRHPGVDVFQGRITVVDGEGQPSRTLVDAVKQSLLTPRRAETIQGERMAASLLQGNWLYWPSLMFRTDTLRRYPFRDDLPIILDLALLIDIAFEGGALRYDPRPVFRYRRHSESLSQKTLLDGSRFEDELGYYREVARDARRRGWRRAERAARVRLMSRLHGIAVLPVVLRRGTARGRRSALRLAFAP